MLTGLVNLLNRPFPLIEEKKEKFILSLTIGAFVFAFLIVFQPFGLRELGEFKTLYFLGYGAVTFLVEILFTFVLMKFFHGFYDAEQWTLGKHLLNAFLLIVSLAFFNWLFTIWVVYSKHIPFTPFLADTLAVGFFPLIFIFLFLERRLRLKNIGLSKELNNTFLKHTNISDGKSAESEIPLLKIEGINIKPENFLCVKSMGNYVTLCYLENNKVRKETIRTTMKQIENSVKENADIVRCHKSYFVNLKKVTNSSGNARSLYLEIEGLNFQVPVSRKIAKELFAKVA